MDDPGWPGDRLRAIVARIGDICDDGVERAGVDGAAVSILTKDGSPMPVLSTDDLSAVVEDLQFTLGEGPCYEATSSLAPVLVNDLAAEAQVTAPRWPVFLNEARSSGVQAVFAFPLTLGAAALGSLDFYRRTPGALDERQLGHSVRTAGKIGVALIDDDGATPSRGRRASLRMTVHQAAGMVMMQSGSTIEDALLRLRAAAFGEGRSVNEIAADVLEGRRRFEKEQS